jgi:hypothetical protein
VFDEEGTCGLSVAAVDSRVPELVRTGVLSPEGTDRSVVLDAMFSDHNDGSVSIT